MSNPQVITVRVPADLKNRVATIARKQGVSINQLAVYALTEKVTALEAETYFASIWQGKNEAQIMADFDEVMEKVGVRADEDTADWDRM